MNNAIGILGCGWLGLPLAESLIDAGHIVHGTTTSETKNIALLQKGIKGFVIEVKEAGIEGNIKDFLTDLDTLIINIPPKLRRTPYEDFVKKMQLLNEAATIAKIKHIIFVSSTSVYGDVEGEVTEATPPRPSTESGRQLLIAENIFRDNTALRSTIIRFGGLIGPQRHPITMLSGKTGLTNGNEYINLIHLYDCIQIITQCIDEHWIEEVINGVYPYHPTKKEYYTYTSKAMGLKSPTYIPNKGKKGKKVGSFTLLNVKKFNFNTTIRS